MLLGASMQGTLMSRRALHPPPLTRFPSFHMEGGFLAPLALVALLHEKNTVAVATVFCFVWRCLFGVFDDDFFYAVAVSVWEGFYAKAHGFANEAEWYHGAVEAG